MVRACAGRRRGGSLGAAAAAAGVAAAAAALRASSCALLQPPPPLCIHRALPLLPINRRYLLVYPHGCDVANHLSLFLCVADYDKLLPGWSHFAQVRALRVAALAGQRGRGALQRSEAAGCSVPCGAPRATALRACCTLPLSAAAVHAAVLAAVPASAPIHLTPPRSLRLRW